MKGLRNEQGFTMISVVFAFLVLSSMGLTMTNLVSKRAHYSVEESEGQQAFYVAEGGLQYILAEAFKPSSNFTNISTVSNKALGDGTFSVSYANVAPKYADITVTGQVGNSVRHIHQTVSKLPDVTDAISAEGNIDLTASQNATGNVIGDIVYGGNYTEDPGYTVTGNVQNGTPINDVDIQPYINMATSTHVGNLTINSDFTGFLHVTGNVKIKRSPIITGMIVADGNITVSSKNWDCPILNGTLASNGNIIGKFKHQSGTIMEAQEVNGDMLPLMIAEGNIDLEFFHSTNSVFRGLIHAEGNVDFKLRQHDVVRLDGAIRSGGNIRCDIKQCTLLTIDYSNGQTYLGGNDLNLSNWHES